MDEIITGFVGLDAHAESTAIGFAEAGRAAPRFIGTVGAKRAELTKALGKLGDPGSLLVVYEAGPCGYGLARELTDAGYRCEVIAPSKIPKKPGERIKTDRRDALKLAGLARAGELVAVTIPDERDEAIRDLARARVDAVRARLKARQQLKALLLRDEDESALEIRLQEGAIDATWSGGTSYTGGDPLIDASLLDGMLRFGPVENSPALVVVLMQKWFVKGLVETEK